jgi:hypothetical protein
MQGSGVWSAHINNVAVTDRDRLTGWVQWTLKINPTRGNHDSELEQLHILSYCMHTEVSHFKIGLSTALSA